MDKSHVNQIDLYNVYLVVFIILSISLLYHTFIYQDDHVEKHKKKYSEYMNTAHSGLIRGLIFGIILGDMGVMTGIKNGAIYGMANPLFLYLGY